MNDKKIKNPFANEDGSPIDGEEPDFFEWEKQRAIKELDKLPPEEKEKAIESERALNERMNS